MEEEGWVDVCGQGPRAYRPSPVCEDGEKGSQPLPVIFGVYAEEAAPSRWV